MAELQIKLVLGNLDMYLQGESDTVYKLFCDIRDNGLGRMNDSFGVQKIEMHQEDDDIKVCSEIEKNKDRELGELQRTKNKKKNTGTAMQLVRDLDLSQRGEVKGLKEFMEEKKPSTNVQRTTAFVYYLQICLEIDEITIDHIYTCYKTMNYRIPDNLQQNLSDTSSNRYGYINRKDGKYMISVRGSNLIEHDLPKRDK